MIRDKLVSKLKEKEKQKVEHFGERIKNAKETHQVPASAECEIFWDLATSLKTSPLATIVD